jgi:hypothetical protein
MLPRVLQVGVIALAVAGIGWCKDAAPEYVSTTGFRPFVFLTMGGKDTYTMLDAFNEEGPFVRYVSKQFIPNAQYTSGTNYLRFKVNCDRLESMYLGTGETVAEMMVDRPDPKFWPLSNGSSATAGAVTACQLFKKLK